MRGHGTYNVESTEELGTLRGSATGLTPCPDTIRACSLLLPGHTAGCRLPCNLCVISHTDVIGLMLCTPS